MADTKITITYCNSWGYRPRAVRAAAALKDELELDSELKPGPSGSFEVSVNGKTVVRKQTLAFPTEKEIVDAVSQALGPW